MTLNETLADGYYWIRECYVPEPHIAELMKREWWVCGTGQAISINEAVVISERLVPPT